MSARNLVPSVATVLICIAATGHAACIHSVAALQTALTNAQGSTTASDIRIASGTYSVIGAALQFDSSAAGQGAITISGGWDPACTTQTVDASLTVFDGGSIARAVALLQLHSSGGIAVSNMTIRNASNSVASYPAGLVASRYEGNGDVAVDHVILHDNIAAIAGGFLAEVTGTTAGDVHLENNLVYKNTAATGSGGAGVLANNAGGHIFVTSNTYADNVVSLPAGSNMGGLEVRNAATLSNNISWGNTQADVNISGIPSGSAAFVDNDFGTVYGTPGSSSGNLNADPQFVGSGDYHLQLTSPLFGRGTAAPAGGLPAYDLEGNARSYAGTVDLGAYENGDEIFANGFDP